MLRVVVVGVSLFLEGRIRWVGRGRLGVVSLVFGIGSSVYPLEAVRLGRRKVVVRRLVVVRIGVVSRSGVVLFELALEEGSIVGCFVVVARTVAVLYCLSLTYQYLHCALAYLGLQVELSHCMLASYFFHVDCYKAYEDSIAPTWQLGFRHKP